MKRICGIETMRLRAACRSSNRFLGRATTKIWCQFEKQMKLFGLIYTILLLTFMVAYESRGQTNTSPDSSAIQEKDRPLKISKKPKPASGGCSRSSAMARLRVTFDKSGKVSTVEIARPSGCDEFDQNAIKAAKKIKFEPAIKNGDAVTVVRQVEYVYTRY